MFVSFRIHWTTLSKRMYWQISKLTRFIRVTKCVLWHAIYVTTTSVFPTVYFKNILKFRGVKRIFPKVKIKFKKMIKDEVQTYDFWTFIKFIMGSPPKTSPFQPKRIFKIIILIAVWWAAKTVVHYEFLSRGHTTTTDVYHRQLDACQQKLHTKQPALVNRWDPIRLYKEARSHMSTAIMQNINAIGYDVCQSVSP